jgi:hypothetical protein
MIDEIGCIDLGAYMFKIVISFWCSSPFISMECMFEVYFVQVKYCYPCLFSGTIGLVDLLPAFHSQSVFISVNEVGSPVGSRLLDLPFKSSLPISVF